MNTNTMLLGPDDIGGVPELHRKGAAPGRRSLGSNDNFESLLVDKHGNEYDPYSLAWRYLGLYIDCDISGANNNFYRRNLHEDEGDGDDCQRKLLWAAYVDPRYRGNTIEEYQFYDLVTEEWDDSACLASGKRHRCVRMDCHEPHTHFKLVGVFKETDGMYDFTEQLFKHEGYCVWQSGNDDDDTYETMETWMENWPTSCNQLSLPDYYGNTIYIAIHPLPEGNMTLGIYSDEQCTQFSPEMDLSSYIVRLYSYYGYSDRGYEVAETYSQAIETWNEKMSTFKVCQPCRAYNLFSEQNNDHDDHEHQRSRLLGGDDNDGEGEVQERYNCYDDAGYTNVNQCYKFETKTSLAIAEEGDLSLASEQGSILRIKANGKVYGEGGYESPMSRATQITYISLAALAAISFATFVFYVQRHLHKNMLRPRKKRVMPSSLKEAFYGGDVDDDMDGESGVNTYKPADGVSTSENGISGDREIEIGTLKSEAPHPTSSIGYTPPTNDGSDMNWNQLAEVPTGTSMSENECTLSSNADDEVNSNAKEELSAVQANARVCRSATNKLIDEWQSIASESATSPYQIVNALETAVTWPAAADPVQNPPTDTGIQSSLSLAYADNDSQSLHIFTSESTATHVREGVDDDTTICPVGSIIPHIGTIDESGIVDASDDFAEPNNDSQTCAVKSQNK